MRFHLTHGTALELKEAQTVAVRDTNTFCNGIAFSEQPLTANKRVGVEVTSISQWSGGIRLGVTTTDPGDLTSDDLPRVAYPDLAEREGCWVRVIKESLTCVSPCKLTVYLTQHGQLELFINGHHKGALLLGLPTAQSLWLLLDIYGNSNSAKFVKGDEDVPREILARGPAVVEAYEQACSYGTQDVYRTRLMLVGQPGVGKTSLKKALTGQSHNHAEESTDGIDLSASCSFRVSNPSQWTLAVKGDETVRRERLEDSVDLGVLGGIEGLEEEYNQAIATNIAQELIAAKKFAEIEPRSTKSEPTSQPQSNAATPNASANSSPSKTPHTEPVSKNSIKLQISHLSAMHQELPDRVVALVQEIVAEHKAKGKGKELVSKGGSSLLKSKESSLPKGQTVVMNIWDFAGHAAYYTTHQVFLTERAVYCIVFNLCDDLTARPSSSSDKQSTRDMSTLQYMDYWLRSIHAHAAENTNRKVDNSTLSPPILIVGTHRNSLHSDPEIRAKMIEDKFAEIQDFVMGKPYVQHIVLPFYAVENSLQEAEEKDNGLDTLREAIEQTASSQPYMGEQIPIKWLRFEQDFTSQADEGINFASFDQVYEMAVNHNITGQGEVQALLQFYHDLGMLVYYGSEGAGFGDNIISNTVVLNPQWLINMFQRVTTSFPPKEQWNLLADKWNQLIDQGILDETLLPVVWSDLSDHRPFLLSLMAKFDLICPRLPPAGQSHRYSSKSYYVPMRFAPCKEKKKIYAQTVHDGKFYIDFNGFLPDGLFHRIQTRVINWSQEHGGRDLYLSRGLARVFLDPDHDLLLEMAPQHLHRIKVLVMHVKDKEATSSKRNSCPSPEVVAKVRNFLETCLVDLRAMWMKRLAYKLCFQCPCEKKCLSHDQEACAVEDCMHFIDLDESLANQIVCCEHRRVKTDCYKKWFPPLQSQDYKEPILAPVSIEQGRGNIERHIPNLPGWLKGAAKLLNGAPENQGWLALAKLMGYKQGRLDLLNEDLNPSLALLTDWIVSSGNTSMSVDVLLHYLQQLGTQDVVEAITRAKETEMDRPQIFLSYQWDIQDEVSSLRDHLERAGFSCWMDIGQMGGGDHLYTKIDQGLRNCKVVVACVTPKYIASQLCNRELWLADMLQLPIIPVVMETVSWPPPGGMAVILAQLVYINMKGVGGHGGTGIHADLMDKYSEIVQRVSLYAQPDLTPCLDTTSVITSSQHEPIPSQRIERLSDRLSGYRTSMSSLSEVDFQRHTARHESSLDVMLSRYGDGPEPSVNYTGFGAARAQRSSHVVPQADVKKCAVCAIL